uniref:Uncharacterized protein n=1 Tax=Ananas comosus var. bracteatus TaxID=296719 RepID=A0A6V7PEJ9_ANACO|nr:unnamed protein product [Ananas comosus var. bracteatus]
MFNDIVNCSFIQSVAKPLGSPSTHLAIPLGGELHVLPDPGPSADLQVVQIARHSEVLDDNPLHVRIWMAIPPQSRPPHWAFCAQRDRSLVGETGPREQSWRPEGLFAFGNRSLPGRPVLGRPVLA